MGKETEQTPEAGSLFERRQKYIQRQIALDKGDVNVRFRGQPPEGRGPANRHGMPQLPVANNVTFLVDASANY